MGYRKKLGILRQKGVNSGRDSTVKRSCSAMMVNTPKELGEYYQKPKEYAEANRSPPASVGLAAGISAITLKYPQQVA